MIKAVFAFTIVAFALICAELVLAQYGGDVERSEDVLDLHGVSVDSLSDLRTTILSPDSDPDLRVNVAAYLARAELQGSGALLAEAIRSPNSEIANAAVSVMHRVSKPEVTSALRDVVMTGENLDIQLRALAVLARNRDRQTLEKLALSKSAPEALRARAIMGHMFVWEQRDELQISTLLEDQSPEIRAAAAVVLSARSANFPVETLIEISESRSFSEGTLRRLAIEAYRRQLINKGEQVSHSTIHRKFRLLESSALRAEIEKIRIESASHALTE